jgi:hypothetical protein
MKPYFFICLVFLVNPESSFGQNSGIFFCSQITCGADCNNPCGWSSLFNACLFGSHTTPSEKTKGTGCTTHAPHGMGMGMGQPTTTTLTTSPTTTTLTTSPTTTTLTTSPTTTTLTTSPTTTTLTTSPTTTTLTTSLTTTTLTTSPTTTTLTTSPTTSKTTTSPTTSKTTSTTLTTTSITSQFITSETLNVSEIVVPIIVTLAAILLVFLGGTYYRRRRSHILEEDFSQKEDEIEYAEPDEQYNDESQQMYLEPVLLKNQGITTNQRINRQVIVNPNYNPDDNDYEYVSSNELPIADREYDLSDNQLQFNADGMYDFATATENKNPQL